MATTATNQAPGIAIATGVPVANAPVGGSPGNSPGGEPGGNPPGGGGGGGNQPPQPL